MITQIATASVYVKDQEKSLHFWTETMGFEVKADHPMGQQGKWIEVPPKNGQARLVLYPRSLLPDWKERKPSLIFLCDDIQKTYKELQAKGVKFPEPPKKMSWGTYATFKDTDGNRFLLKGESPDASR